MTKNKEDYLKAIYEEGGERNLVSNKSVAAKLGVAGASVTEMLIKLKKEGLIYYEAYKGSRLTGAGLDSCIHVVRSHRLWEVFLIRHLGYSWSEAHEEAHLLEHAASEQMVDRLDTFLNYPPYCPHGSVIPGKGRTHSEKTLVLLSDLAAGDRAVIRRVQEEKELLDYLQEKKIQIGCEVAVNRVEKYEGPVHLLIGSEELQISYKAALQLYVERV